MHRQLLAVSQKTFAPQLEASEHSGSGFGLLPQPAEQRTEASARTPSRTSRRRARAAIRIWSPLRRALWISPTWLASARPGYKYDLHVHGTSCGAPVVVVEASEYRAAADRSDELRRSGNGLLVCESLVRTSLIVERYEFGYEASEMLLREDEEVVQELTSQRADEPFGEGIRARRMDRRTHDSARQHATRWSWCSSRSSSGPLLSTIAT